ncbi:MAG TPA: hypothetical protein VMS79_00645, partial [Methanomassiliicoccales archaeon]|nr:hypothetical protein [Methanomassiliicoccales archaeon]
MAQSSVLREIRSLREDIGQMKGHLVSMRYEDFRQAFVDELALAAGQEGVRSLDDLSGIQGATDCKARSACTSKIRESVVRLADDLRQDDTDAARRRLSELEGVLCGDASPCQDSACNAAAIQTLNRVRTVLDVYERVRTRLHEDDGGGASRERPTESAEEIERALAPLANARRLEALRWLAAEDLSLSDLARKLG